MRVLRNAAPQKPLAKPKAVSTSDPGVADRFNRVLGEVVEAMESARLRYAFIGGIASGGLGRPRSTRDIDIFVKPEDAELTLLALSSRGFRIEKTDPSWLYKGWKENILVDVIFKSKGEIFFDSEMAQRTITAEFHGRKLTLVAPEDLLIIKAVAHSELCPGHWHDAIGLLSHAAIDWEYLLRRARRAPRRVLSLLLYAQSSDIHVPNRVIYELYASVFLDERTPSPQPAPAPITTPTGPGFASAPNLKPLHVRGHRHTDYAIAHLREALAEDSRTNELDIHIEKDGDTILLRGEVQGRERKEAVGNVAHELFPDAKIENQLRVQEFREPSESEGIQ
jgi:hypothetical protein